MSTGTRARALVLGMSVVLGIGAGCASTPAGADGDEVRALVESRTKLRVPDHASPQVDAEVRKLLGDEDLTADRAVQVAFLRNARLQSLYEDVGIANADLVQAGRIRNPVFDGAVRFGAPGGTELDLGIAQEFLSILFLPLRKRVAAAELEATKLRVAAGVLEIDAHVRDAFHRLQAEMQLLEMREQVRTATSASHDAAKALREAGNVRDLDVDAERGLFDRAQLAAAASQSAVAAARERLNAAMGVWGDETSWRVAARLPELPAQAADVNDVERRAVAASLDLARLRAEIDGAARSAEGEGASRGLDEVEVGASAERADGDWGVGPSVRIPLPLFDPGRGRVARALATLRQREHELRADAVEVRAAARAAAQRLATAQAVARFHRDEVIPMRTRVVEATQLQYNAMQVGIFQLLTAKQDQIEAGQDYVEALREYWLARTALEHMLRGGRPRDAFAPAEVAGARAPRGESTGPAGRRQSE